MAHLRQSTLLRLAWADAAGLTIHTPAKYIVVDTRGCVNRIEEVAEEWCALKEPCKIKRETEETDYCSKCKNAIPQCSEVMRYCSRVNNIHNLL